MFFLAKSALNLARSVQASNLWRAASADRHRRALYLITSAVAQVVKLVDAMAITFMIRTSLPEDGEKHLGIAPIV